MEILIAIIMVIIVALFTRFSKENSRQQIIKNCLVTFYICILFYMGIVLPYYLLNLVLKEKVYTAILTITSIIMFVYSIIVIITALKNKKIKEKNKIKDIYIRDIDVNYNPAIVSYLMNGKIEQNKDLVAVLLNLCAENILKIEYDKTGKLNIIDMHNDLKVENLSNSDMIAYEMFITKITTSKINKWKKAVYEEYKTYNFSKENKHSLANSMVILYLAFIIIVFIAIFVFGKNGILVLPGKYGQIFVYVLVSIFFAVWETSIFSSTKIILNKINNKDENNTFKDIYTKKGAKEYDKWIKFKRFVKDFSNIDKAELESIVIFEKYLAYAIALNVNKEYKEVEFNIIKDKINIDINNIIEDINK